MSIASQRGPMGQKTGKTGPKPRKPVRKVSKKRAHYLASTARMEGKLHMAKVAQLPCLVCGAWPVEVHHEESPRSDMRVLPLCPQHHRREYGPGAYHYAKPQFYAAHGDSEALLKRVARMLADQFEYPWRR